jgi:hypothetical protein
MEAEMRKITVLCLSSSGVAAIVISVGAASVASNNVSPIYGVTLPEGYRGWQMITVAHEAGKNNDIRGILGNDIAAKAFREGTRPFPDGSRDRPPGVRLQVVSRKRCLFPALQSFVASDPTNVQISVKDSKKYAGSGGWGYGQFENGVINQSEPLMKSCGRKRECGRISHGSRDDVAEAVSISGRMVSELLVNHEPIDDMICEIRVPPQRCRSADYFSQSLATASPLPGSPA